MNTLVTLGTYEQPKTAYFLKEKLESENIDCFFSIVSNSNRRWDKVRVQVKPDDVENAIKVMLRIKDVYGMEIDEIEPTEGIRKIVVPTDFSENCENACIYAIYLAEACKAEIKLLHVYENPITDINIKKSATYEVYVEQALRDKEKNVKEDLVAFADKMKAYIKANKIKDVRIHSSMVMGNIIGKIKGICQIYNPDFIVLGTVGKKEASHSVLGGVVNEIINGMEIPVFAVPCTCKDTDFRKFNILYATDFNEKDHYSLDQLIRIMEPFEKEITCIHIDTAQNPAKGERMDELNAFLVKDYSQHKINCQLIEDEDVFHGLKEFANRNHINLLSFTVQKRGIFEKLFKPNLFRKILQEANLPILIFPS